MSIGRRQLAAFSLVSGLLLGASSLSAEPGTRLNGTLVGVVSDSSGRGQMGATVFLYNRFEKLVKRVLTNEKGAFGFDALMPDSYTIRVSLPAFVPAVRQNILIQPGMRSFLAINLASVLSSIELVSASPSPGTIMSDDWKWVLRSSMSSRPVLRLLPGMNPSTGTSTRAASLFQDTRGRVQVQAGDGANPLFGSQPDLGTAFAVATSLYGNHELQVSGNVGYASRGGLPAAAFRTRFTSQHENPFGHSSPEVLLTVRQAFLPGLVGMTGPAPMLRTMSTAFLDRLVLGDRVDVLYGAQLESVTYYERLNVVSPFARMTVRLTGTEDLQLAYSGGTPPEELFLSNNAAVEQEVGRDLGTLSAFPRVSLRDRHAHIQRMENLEIAYHRRLRGTTQLSVAAFQENVANAALTAMGGQGMLPESELLPDPFSRSSIFNIGSYRRNGVMTSVTHHFSPAWTVAVFAGNSGTLSAESAALEYADAAAVRHALRRIRRNWASVRIAGQAPVIGTQIVASYLLTDYRAALPAHRYLTQRISPDVGLNFTVHQPLPSLGLWAGRIEAIVEFRNALSQGYQTIRTTDGQQMTLMPAPRTIRGGLAFIF